jgi:hypothetical protein
VNVDLLTIANGGCCLIVKVSGGGKYFFAKWHRENMFWTKAQLHAFFSRELLLYQLHLDIFSCKQQKCFVEKAKLLPP